MNLRQVKFMMITVLFLWGITGCGTPMSDGDDGGSGSEDVVSQTDGPVTFQYEREEDLPEPVRVKMEEWKQVPPTKPVHTEVEHDGTRFVVLASPQKPSGGYTIRINQVIREDDQVTIHAEEVPPAEDSTVIQALTTPMAVISIQTEDDANIQLNMKEAQPEESDSSEAPHTSLTIQSERLEKLPPSVKEEVEMLRNRTQGGEKAIHHDGRQFVIIALGERRTGGYHVEVDEVNRRGEEVHVYAREVGPEPGMMVTQTLTYPLKVVSFESKQDESVTIHLQRSQSAPNRPDR